MEFKEHNLITRIWIFCHSEYDHVCFDHPSSETCAKHSVGVEEFSSCIVVPALRNLWLFLVFNNVLISLTLYFCLYIKDKSAELRKKREKRTKKTCGTKLYQLRQCVLCSKDSSEKLGCPFDSV